MDAKDDVKQEDADLAEQNRQLRAKLRAKEREAVELYDQMMFYRAMVEKK